MDVYRDRKLLEHYLETSARKNGLTVTEASLLLCLSQPHQIKTREELADFANVSRNTLSLTLQKLSMRGLLKVEDMKVTDIPSNNKKDWISNTDSIENNADIQTARLIPKSRRKQIHITLLPEARPVLDDLAAAQNDYDHARFNRFSEEELIQYAHLSEKIKENIQNVLG